MAQSEKPVGKPVEAPVQDHAADIIKVRVAQIDERIAAAKAELADLTARRSPSHVDGRSRTAVRSESGELVRRPRDCRSMLG